MDLDFFFYPKSIAVIGVSKEPTKGGNIILNNIKNGFKGDIYPVNPKYDEIYGIRCFRDVCQLPGKLDLAIVFVLARAVKGIVKSLVKKKVKGIIIESGGFAESGELGVGLQKEIMDIVKDSGTRIWGPNCMGIVDMHTQHVFSFVSPGIWEYMYPGDISLIVQSGMLSAGFLINLCSSGRFGISKACSIGNKLDVDECDLLEFLDNDPHTKVIGMYLESIKQGRRFFDLCMCLKKPVVLLKGGKTGHGKRAALTHTASAAGSSEVISGMLKQTNLIEATDFLQMMDICLGLSNYGDMEINGNRLGILTYSGGAGIVSVDLLKDTHLEVSEFSRDTIEKIKSLSPDWLPIGNPADVWPAVEKNGPEAYEAIFKAICEDKGVDIVFMHYFGSGKLGGIDLKKIKEISEKYNTPVFLWASGDKDTLYNRACECRELKIPMFLEISRAIEVMDKFVTYKNRDRLHKDLLNTPIEIGPCIKDLYLSGPGVVLDEFKAKEILSKFNIPVVTEYKISSLDHGLEKVREIGYPVVLKGILPGIVHKTEHGLVEKNIFTDEKFVSAYKKLNEMVLDKGFLLVQQQLDIKLELIFGMIRDKDFGSVVMMGFGGTIADLLDDRVFRLAPFSLDQAMLYTFDLKNQRLFDGYRDIPKIDREQIAHVLKVLGDIGHRFQEIDQIDINPMVVTQEGIVCVDSTIIIAH